MYFSKFPQIYYGFPNSDNSDVTLQILSDITLNVRFKKAILENVTIYDEYDIEEGETPEIIAEKIYGNPEYHWIIMLLNDRYNYLEDFPMSEAELNQYIADTYGDARYETHHYEKNGNKTEALGTLTIPTSSDFISAIRVGDKLTSTVGYVATVVAVPPSTNGNEIQVRFDNNTYSPSDVLTHYGVRLNSDESAYTYQSIAKFQLPASNSVTVSDVYENITNELYEIDRNESKRRIKLISPELLTQILNEFENLV